MSQCDYIGYVILLKMCLRVDSSDTEITGTGKFDANLCSHFMITHLAWEAEVNLVRLP